MKQTRRRSSILATPLIGLFLALLGLVLAGVTRAPRNVAKREPVDRIAWVEPTGLRYQAEIRSEAKSAAKNSPIRLPSHKTKSSRGTAPVQSASSGNRQPDVKLNSRGTRPFSGKARLGEERPDIDSVLAIDLVALNNLSVAEDTSHPRIDFLAQNRTGAGRQERAAPDPVEVRGEQTIVNDSKPASEQAADRADSSTRPSPVAPATPSDSVQSPLAEPAKLLAQLDSLAEVATLVDWTKAVREQVVRLFSKAAQSNEPRKERVARLAQLVGQGRSLARQMQSYDRRAQLNQTLWAVERRLGLWKRFAAWSDGEDEWQTAAQRMGRDVVQPALRAAGDYLEGNGELEGWHDYLMIDRMSEVFRSGEAAKSRSAALEVLRRMEVSSLTPAQRVFLMQPAIAQLRSALAWYSSEEPRYLDLISQVEEFEASHSASSQAAVAATLRTLRDAPHREISSVGLALEKYYRNANLRLVVARPLLNRFIPDIEPREEPVTGHMLGASISGRSATSARLAFRFVPDPTHVRVRLEARGIVASDTAARKGPVTVFSEGQSNYVAGKLFLLGGSGLISDRAEARANSRSWTKAIQTDYDRLPLVGAIVRRIARGQHEEQLPRAHRQMNDRVTDTARQRLDAEVDDRMHKLVEQIDAKFVKPFVKLDLQPRAVDLKTTAERITMRFRLAGDHQLASYTPRPMALSSSVASLQIHQSTVNNVIQQLGLGMEQADLRGLYEETFRKLKLEENRVPDDVPHGVSIELNYDHPIQVSFDAGQVTLEIHVDRMSHGRRRWRNFVVRVHYEPSVSGMRVVLQRTGYMELIGRLRTRDQFALRGIFTKALGRNRTISIVPSRIADDPRLAGLEIGQCRIADGWIGFALVPARGSALALKP